MAVALRAYLYNAPAEDAERRQSWLDRLAEKESRVIWAGVFDGDARGFEFRRESALPREEILAQIDFTKTESGFGPLRVGQTPSRRFLLLTCPEPHGGGALAAVVDLEETESRLAPVIGLAWGFSGFIGVLLALAGTRGFLSDPLRRLARNAAEVEAEIGQLALAADAPAEIQELARSLHEAQRDLKKYRAEAAQLRHSLEYKVDARTKAAEKAAAQAERAAGTDALTKVFNRRQLELDLPQAVALAREERSELAALWIDVDHFKNLNDSLGHQAGDDLLAFLGQILRGSFRKQADRAYRYGGDEFVILLPGTNGAEARQAAERLVAFFSQRVKALPKLNPPASLSIGIALLKAHAVPTAETLLELADQAMYHAKWTSSHVADVDEFRKAQTSGQAASPSSGPRRR